jgi:NAD dependent epimerase/dehydratase
LKLSEKAFITGAGGFIGSHLTELLIKSGYHVKALVHYNSESRWGALENIDQKLRESVEIVYGDVRDAHHINQLISGCDLVFHLAALIAIPYSYHAPLSYLDTNGTGTLNVTRSCLENDVRLLIHTSTSETFGTAQYEPIDERHPIVAQSPYTASKISGDKIVESFHLSFDLPVVTIRPFNTYGPRQSARAIIPTIISQILSGRKSIKLGSLTPEREFNFVKDIVRAFVAAVNKEKAIGKLINIGNGQKYSIGELAAIIMDRCECDLPIEQDQDRMRPEKSEVMRLVCDNRLAQEILDWKPEYDIYRGIDETIDWSRDNMSRFKADRYNI